MKLSKSPITLSLLAIPTTVLAGPFPKDALHDLGFSFLKPRACDSYCGAENQYCCTAGQACYTTANIAFCSAGVAAAPQALTVGAGGGGYAVYTFTLTETDLVFRTTTSTSYWQAAPSTAWVAPAPAPTVAGAPILCTVQGQTSCGIYCCAIDQKCGGENQCVPRPDSSFYPMPTTGTYSAPYRPTDGVFSTATTVISGSGTTTAPFLAPATASGSAFPTPIAVTGGGGLSPGAIAGIVIGVIAAIIILLLICFCCIVKAGFSGLLAIFGLGKKKHRSTERIETTEHYSRHGSGTGSRRETHGGWFGKPTRVDSSRKKKSSGFGGLGAVGAGLAGLALILGLKKKHDKEKPRSDVSSSYYTDSFTGTSASSASSDRRTRDSRRPR